MSAKSIIKALGNGRVTPPESLMETALSALPQSSGLMCRFKTIACEVSFNLAEPMPKKPAKAESQHHSHFNEGRLKGSSVPCWDPLKSIS